jgi:periplasmic copper chaperone A
MNADRRRSMFVKRQTKLEQIPPNTGHRSPVTGHGSLQHIGRCIAFVIGLILAASAAAQVTVDQPWVRATAPGQPVAAAYLKIKSAQAAALVAVRTPVTARAGIHEMKMEGGVMKMRPVARIELPAGKTVELEPGGYHLMLMNIAKPLRPGETVPMTLVIEGPDKKRTEVKINAEVRDLTGGMSGHGMKN